MSGRLPVVFVGHGNPMNALADNAYTRALAALGRDLPRPDAVLCVSAHWMTEGFALTGDEYPRTLHDFACFPPELSAVRYPAAGSPVLARRAAGLCGARLAPEGEWGLDHGAWAVLRRMYPEADIPVVQLSIDPERGPREHHDLVARLAGLREEGVLILGSGNVVHNLRLMTWRGDPPPEPWASEFDSFVAQRLRAGDRDALLGDTGRMPGGARSVPTPDHWLPLAAVLGAVRDGEAPSFPYEGIDHGTMSMRCVRWG